MSTSNRSQGSAGSAGAQQAGDGGVSQWHGTVFTNAKAGMAGVDQDKVKKIVYAMSKVPCSS